MPSERWRARVAGGIAALLLPLVAPAAAPAAEVRYAAGFFSHYVWRGITLTDGPVFQPSVRISHASGFAFEAWGNLDLDDDNDAAAEFSETRLTFDYGRRLGDFEIGAGLVEYLFPNTPFPGTRELYVRLALDAVVSPRFELFYDVDELDGGYARFALAWERALRPNWTLALEASAAWADANFAVGGEAGPHDAALELRLERSAGRFDLRLQTGWTEPLDPDVLPDQETSFWAGATVAFRL